jgi:radical SAM superfamily enzyme YgiQ (UPF0313 family)
MQNIMADAESCEQNYLFFLDDNISGDKKFAKELFENLIPLKKRWVGQASVNIAGDKELLTLAKKSGCRALLIGFESMTDKGLNLYRKSLKSMQENVDAVKRLQDYDIMTMSSLIFGIDNDTLDVFDTGLEFIERSKTAFYQSCIATPYPGTPVYERLKKEGRILTDDWRNYDATKVIIEPTNFSSETLLEESNRLQKKIYSNTSIMKRAWPNMMCGFDSTLFYLSLNKGYQKLFNQKKSLGVMKNAPDVPVDFDISKYVMPVKEVMPEITNEIQNSCISQL